MSRPHRTDGDGWVDCTCGQRHWGRYGAAGLMLVDDRRVLMQHRAVWSHQGGTWALPGGARSSTETALAAALREASEEAAVTPDAVRPSHAWVEDHGPWSYTTVVGTLERPVVARPSDPESVEIRWVARDEVADKPLHPAFAVAWPRMRMQAGRRLVLVVDAANVVGSRPDGWWRDRAGAAARLRDSLVPLAERGVPASAFALPADRWWPDVRMVVEGQAREVRSTAGVRVLAASRDGDALIVDEVSRATIECPADHVVAATADRALRSRLETAGATVVGPRTLLDLI